MTERVDDKQLITTLALAERLCPSMNGASSDRFADVLETLGPAGIDSPLGLDEDEQRRIDEALSAITADDRDRWDRTIAELRADGVEEIVTAVETELDRELVLL